jgi:hypothetical protein
MVSDMWKQKYYSRILCVGQVVGATVGYVVGSWLEADLIWRIMGFLAGLFYGTILTHGWLTGWHH